MEKHYNASDKTNKISYCLKYGINNIFDINSHINFTCVGNIANTLNYNNITEDEYQQLIQCDIFNDIIYISYPINFNIQNIIYPINIQVLHARGCNLRIVPLNLPKSLIILNLSHNHISRFTNFPEKVKYLDISNNNLGGDQRIEPNINKLLSLPEELEYLDISYNDIFSIDINMPTTLKFLNISDTELTKIPKNIPHDCELHFIRTNIKIIRDLPKKLREVKIVYCDLEDIINLPDDIEELTLVGSDIEIMPNLTMYKKMKKLTVIGFHSLKYFIGLPDSLKILTISDCKALKQLFNIDHDKKNIDLKKIKINIVNSPLIIN